jgi:hypothetical protein
VSLALPEPRNIPSVVRARVMQSIAYSTHFPLPGGGGVRVVARRVSGLDGLAWSLRYDQRTDRDDPAVRAAATEALGRAQAGAGPPVPPVPPDWPDSSD